MDVSARGAFAMATALLANMPLPGKRSRALT
jgi:hypothetical protein